MPEQTIPHTLSGAVAIEHGTAFAMEATAALGELRIALSALIRALPGSPRRGTEVQKALHIDSKLAWAIHKVATASEPLAAGTYVPGRAPMIKVLKAASAKGVHDDAISRARAAFEQFEAMVERHAGDRGSFDTMVADLAGEGAENIDLASKRAAFRINGHLWGVQARTDMTCQIIRPSRELAGGLDEVLISGRVGLRQLRKGKILRAEYRAKLMSRASPGKAAQVLHRAAIDPEDTLGPGGIGLLRAFCSTPLPEFRTNVDQEGWVRAELLSRGFGNTAALTYFVGSLIHGYAPTGIGTPTGPRWFSLANIPAEVMYEDLLVHEDAWRGGPPRVGIYGTATTPGNPSSWQFREEDLLPIQESIVEIGRGVDALDTPEVPRYPEMVRYAMERAGWGDMDRYRLFRLRIEYPVLYSLAKIEFPDAT